MFKRVYVKKVLLIVVVLTALVVGVALVTGEKPAAQASAPSSSRPLVAVSTFALYDIVRYVGGDAVDLFMVVPFGVDVHGFEPTPQDLARLSKSDLFVYSGAGLEPWAENFAATVNTLDVSKHVRLLYPEEDEGAAAEDKHVHEGHAHEHEGGADPHYWLDIDNMVAATKAVEKALGALNADAASMFHRKAEIYIAQLQMLDEHHKEVLGSCNQKMIVVNHNAFGYLSKRYGFEVKALAGLSPEAMPSARTMAELSDLVKEHRIKTIFFESFVSDALMQSLAKESGARVDVLQPLANIAAEEAAKGTGFKRLMEMNLNKLLHAMECE